MISGNPNVSFGIVDCSLHTRRNALKVSYHKKHDWTYMHLNVWSLTIWRLQQTRSSFLPDKTSSLKKHFQQCCSSSDRYCNEYKLCIHKISYWKSIPVSTIWSRTNKNPQRRSANVDFDAADNCRLYVTTMKAMNFQDDIPSIPIDIFKDHYVLVFDLTSMHDATGNCH